MYRDGQKWANSFHRFFQMNDQPLLYDQQTRDFIWWILSVGQDPAQLAPYLDLEADQVYPEQVFAPAWALHIEEYLKHFENGLPFLALRYNELNRDREPVTAQLLAHCKLPASALSDAMRAFDSDSQEGSEVARDREVESFSDENYARFRETLRKHPRFKDPDLLLPDIYQPDRPI
jgi:hypothetical protein